MAKGMTQTEKVLDYLNRFHSITPLQAFSDLSIMRLGARIWDLKKQGVMIVTETQKAKNRFGDDVHFARYSLSRNNYLEIGI